MKDTCFSPFKKVALRTMTIRPVDADRSVVTGKIVYQMKRNTNHEQEARHPYRQVQEALLKRSGHE
ncbi:hypothetical protein [Spirosoma endbachense]|uniref:Uncharacterized protein n=1 Tax=Spirosoma endbachense TaxID=2666025 RepID=A0A6P1VL49_9BACT|nr:hypothetical protein [Spirosoma endbachense]QHV93991.1 hypothetical protein GJR95_02660 [Spirosoma endbachense]